MRHCLFLILSLSAIFPAGVPAGPAAITVAGCMDNTPYEFLDSSGQPRGILVRLWRLWSEQTGIAVNYLLVPEAELAGAVQNGRADVIGGIHAGPEAGPEFALSAPYLSCSIRVFKHAGMAEIGSLKDLLAYRIGIIRGSPAATDLRRRMPDLAFAFYPDRFRMIEAALAGEVRVVIGDAAATLFYLGKSGQARKMVQSSVSLPPVKMHAAVPADKADLITIIDKGFAAIDARDRNRAVRMWTGISLGHRIPWQLISIGTLLLLFIMVALGFWLWNDQLRHRIHDATADLREKQTQLMRSEAELRENQEKYKALYSQAHNDRELYRSLINSSADAIIICDPDGCIRFVNPAFTRLFGWTGAELDGKPPPYLPADEQRRNESICRDPGNRNTEFQGVEGQCLTRDGRRIDMNLSASVYHDHHGNRAGTLWILRDMTETKRLEAELRQSQKMEAIGTLAGGIAHDFNNILSAMIGYAELAQLVSHDPERVRRSLEKVVQAGQRATDLVRQILSFSRRSEHELRPTCISPIVKEVLKLLRASFPATIEIEQRISSGLHPVNADATQIHQVLMNLCTNARHAMQERGGRLNVTLEPVEITAERRDGLPRDLPSGPYLRLTVADTGNGIPPAILHRIFDPYFTTKDRGEGTGLGLSVVHGIIHRHGGGVTVDSRPGEGTVFRVYLPQLPEQAVEMPVQGTRVLTGGTEHILLVDDEPFLAEVGREILSQAGYTVTICTDSHKALTLFREAPDRFDLVLTDMTMPKMTGAELARQMLALRPEVPVFLCTGFSESITADTARQIGIHAFFMKPLNYRKIAKAIREAFPETASPANPASRQPQQKKTPDAAG